MREKEGFKTLFDLLKNSAASGWFPDGGDFIGAGGCANVGERLIYIPEMTDKIN